MRMKTPLEYSTALLGVALLTLSARFAMAEAPKVETKDAYPLTTCIVTGEKLGEMGKPYVHTYEGQEVKFCCKGCLKDFNKDPKKYIAKLAAASAPAKK